MNRYLLRHSQIPKFVSATIPSHSLCCLLVCSFCRGVPGECISCCFALGQAESKFIDACPRGFLQHAFLAAASQLGAYIYKCGNPMGVPPLCLQTPAQGTTARNAHSEYPYRMIFLGFLWPRTCMHALRVVGDFPLLADAWPDFWDMAGMVTIPLNWMLGAEGPCRTMALESVDASEVGHLSQNTSQHN